MPADPEERSIPAVQGTEVDAAKISGGDVVEGSVLVTDVSQLYDSLVDSTSQAIERVMTTAKTF